MLGEIMHFGKYSTSFTCSGDAFNIKEYDWIFISLFLKLQIANLKRELSTSSGLLSSLYVDLKCSPSILLDKDKVNVHH